jgi:hypothetical protein
MRRREPPQRYLPDEEATRPQHGGTRHITVADLKLATRSLATRTGAAAFREMSLRELRQELTAHLRIREMISEKRPQCHNQWCETFGAYPLTHRWSASTCDLPLYL